MESKASDGKKAAAIAERIMIEYQEEIENNPISMIKALTFITNGIVKYTKSSAIEEDKDALEPMILYCSWHLTNATTTRFSPNTSTSIPSWPQSKTT